MRGVRSLYGKKNELSGRGNHMYKVSVLGSEFLEAHVERIKALQIFSDIELSYISDGDEKDTFSVEEVLSAIKAQQCQALVLGQHDYGRISCHVDIPCYILHPSIQDFLLLYQQISDLRDTAVIFPEIEDVDLSALEKCVPIRFHKYFFGKRSEIDGMLLDIRRKGYQAVIGGNVATKKTRRLGMRGYYYFSQKTVEDGIQNAVQIIRNMEREDRYISEIHSILENTTCGVIYITGATGNVPAISYVNQTALELLDISLDELTGKSLDQLFPGKVLQLILNGNEPERDLQFALCGTDVIGNIISLHGRDDIPGSCILFEKVSQIFSQEAKIQREVKRKSFGTRYTFRNIIGKSPALQNAIRKAKRFAASTSTILIRAETGSGKEVFAQSIHEYSPRAQYPFVAINCGSIPDTLIESELFGYAPGSFTGANAKGKRGLIELANHGTVFLDDVDALSPNFQAKLLRVMQEREIIRVGGDSVIPVDVRFIVATNRDLKAMAEAGEFRSDLYYRINVLGLTIPPLRERGEDIPALYKYYLQNFNDEIFGQIYPLFEQAFSVAFAYSYPGNVRELISVAERFVALVENEQLSDLDALSQLVRECLDSKDAFSLPKNSIRVEISGSYRDDIKNAENQLMKYYVEHGTDNMSLLAKQLGISRSTLYTKLREQEDQGI